MCIITLFHSIWPLSMEYWKFSVEFNPRIEEELKELISKMPKTLTEGN